MTERRTYTVTRADARRTITEWLHRHLKLSWNDARRRVKDGHVSIDGKPCRDSTQRLQRGQSIAVSVETPDSKTQNPKPRRGKSEIVIRFADEYVVVVEKPAGLTTMRHAHEAAEFGQRARRFLPNTLEDLLTGLLQAQTRKKARVIAVHRLDKETSGLVVFARTPEAAKQLGQQLRVHSMARTYLALVRGQAKDATIESWIVRDRGDGRRGSGEKVEGQRAVTHVKVVETLGEFALVDCRLETGRTHQVRIHLGEAGTPLCGERVYDRPLNGAPLPDTSDAKRIALHAAGLDFDHPATGERVHFTSRLPRDMQQLLERLRNSGMH